MISEKYYRARLCDSNLSYEFYTEPYLSLDLNKLGKELEERGLQLRIRTPFILTFLMEGVDVSLFPSGKILVKNVSVEKKAQNVFKQVIKKLQKCPSGEQV